MNKIKQLFLKYKELILYFIFGVITTVANFLAFYICTKFLGEEYFLFNNAVAWVVGVLVAFITNKLFVFNSKSWELKNTLRELLEFTAARLFSFGVEEAGMWLFIGVLGLGEIAISLLSFTITGQFIVKLVLSVIVVILNYFFSKFVIFKKETDE